MSPPQRSHRPRFRHAGAWLILVLRASTLEAREGVQAHFNRFENITRAHPVAQLPARRACGVVHLRRQHVSRSQLEDRQVAQHCRRGASRPHGLDGDRLGRGAPYDEFHGARAAFVHHVLLNGRWRLHKWHSGAWALEGRGGYGKQAVRGEKQRMHACRPGSARLGHEDYLFVLANFRSRVPNKRGAPSI